MNTIIIIGGGVVVVVLVGALVWWLAFKRGKHTANDNSPLATTLRDEKAKGDIILNTIDDGVVVVDEEQIIRLFNPGATTVTGWQRDEAEGLDWRSVFRFTDGKGQTMEPDATPFAKAMQSGQTVRDNKANITGKSGKSIATSFSVSPLLDGNKQVTGLVGIFRDVSQERQEEAQRAEFISTASHEMRTPVAAIEGYLSLTLNDKVATIDNRARDYLQKAHASTEHLGQLFQDLLTSAKAEDGRLTSHPKVVEVGAYLEQLTSDLRFSAEKKSLFVEFLIGSSSIVDTGALSAGNKVIRPLYYVYADPDRLSEVITNLFDNACKYTESGTISLGLTGDDSVVQLYVKDTGAGIPPEDISHLFQKFYRVDSSATRTIGGTGLGLFICRKIIELYQGRIWVESTIGTGSTFYINLPRLTTQKAEQIMAGDTSGVAQASSLATMPVTTVAPTVPAGNPS